MTSGQASRRVVWPFSGSSRATIPTSGLPTGKPYSSGRVQHASRRSYRERSTPL